MFRSPSFAFLAARTVFFDQAVARALDEGVRQVVIAGAGHDSRTGRGARPAGGFFEVDHPATQVDKRRRAPAGGVVFVPVDLAVPNTAAPIPRAPRRPAASPRPARNMAS